MACAVIQSAPDLATVDYDPEPTRTDLQSAKWHAQIDDILKVHPRWQGIRMDKWRYKQMFLAGLESEQRVETIPNMEGDGLLILSRSSSRLKWKDFSDLIEITYAWGARHGVVFREPATNGIEMRRETT